MTLINIYLTLLINFLIVFPSLIYLLFLAKKIKKRSKK